MKKTVLILALSAVCSVSRAEVINSSVTKHEYQHQERCVEVSARAWREVSPDEIFLQITLDQNEGNGRHSIDQLESRLYEAVKKAGVDADSELKVRDMASQLKERFLGRDEGRATKEFRLKVTAEQLMPVFGELKAAGITTVEILSARYSKVTGLCEELLAEAVETARRRAQIMVDSSNKGLPTGVFKRGKAELGALIHVQTFDNTSMYDGHTAAAGAMYKTSRSEAFAPAPAFEFEEQRVEVNVTARFAIE